MVMYDNEFETKEIKFKPKKLNHNIYIALFSDFLILFLPHLGLPAIKQQQLLK